MYKLEDICHGKLYYKRILTIHNKFGRKTIVRNYVGLLKYD